MHTHRGFTLEYDTSGLLVDQLTESVKKYPQNLAVITPARSFTYTQLHSHAQHVASVLIDKYKIELYDFVGTTFAKNAWMCVSAYGAWYAGAAYVPMDYQIPEKRMESICHDAAIRVFLTSQELNETRIWPGKLSRYAVDADDRPAKKILPPPKLANGDVAYVIFTSGSTGKPKVRAHARTP